MSFQLPKSAVDQLKGFISLCKSKPEIIHNEELTFFREYLLSMNATLPPKPTGGEAAGGSEKKQETPKPASQPSQEEPAEMEVESEESDVELDMEGVIGDPNPNIDQEMGDSNKKELTSRRWRHSMKREARQCKLFQR